MREIICIASERESKTAGRTEIKASEEGDDEDSCWEVISSELKRDLKSRGEDTGESYHFCK